MSIYSLVARQERGTIDGTVLVETFEEAGQAGRGLGIVRGQLAPVREPSKPRFFIASASPAGLPFECAARRPLRAREAHEHDALR
jgi:hypothetical protein